MSKWVDFCCQRNNDPHTTNINNVLLFLHSLFKPGVGYRVLNTARSSLSTFIDIEGTPVGKHPLITRFMRGVFNIRPTLPKYHYTWDAGIAIKHISKMNNDNLKSSSMKLATLLVLLSGQRCGEILSVLDIQNISLSQDMCIFRLGDCLKTSGLRNHLGEIKFPAYHADVTKCPVYCINQYLNKTEGFRGSVTSLFIRLNRPFKTAFKDTLARWVKKTLIEAGINMSIFSPHSTRSASTSKVKGKVSLKTIIKTGC